MTVGELRDLAGRPRTLERGMRSFRTLLARATEPTESAQRHAIPQHIS